MLQILSATGYGLCLDIGHAITAAHNLGIKYYELIESFSVLNPQIYHLNDGGFNNKKDQHLHFGQGNYPLKKIMQQIPSGAKITLETPKNIEGNLSDFIVDLEHLKNL